MTSNESEKIYTTISECVVTVQRLAGHEKTDGVD